MSTTDSRTTRTGGTAVQKAALTVGLVFVAVGILGFGPGITTNDDTLLAWSRHSDAMLLGPFQVSVPHDLVHLILGVGVIAVGVLLTRRTRDRQIA